MCSGAASSKHLINGKVRIFQDCKMGELGAAGYVKSSSSARKYSDGNLSKAGDHGRNHHHRRYYHGHYANK